MNWTLGELKMLLRKIDATDSVERRSGSGRPRTVRVPGVIANAGSCPKPGKRTENAQQLTADFTSNRSFTGVCQQNYSQGLASDMP